MTVDIKRLAVKSAGNLEPVVKESEDQGMEVPTCWREEDERLGREEVEDLEEYLQTEVSQGTELLVWLDRPHWEGRRCLVRPALYPPLLRRSAEYYLESKVNSSKEK